MSMSMTRSMSSSVDWSKSYHRIVRNLMDHIKLYPPMNCWNVPLKKNSIHLLISVTLQASWIWWFFHQAKWPMRLTSLPPMHGWRKDNTDPIFRWNYAYEKAFAIREATVSVVSALSQITLASKRHRKYVAHNDQEENEGTTCEGGNGQLSISQMFQLYI